MDCDSKYVQRVINKYNRRHVIAFVQKRAEKRFLSPLGLTLKYVPPSNFENNPCLLSRIEESELFSALHYMKYKITKTKIKSCRKRYLQIYLALRNRGISANIPLMFKCIKRHAGNKNVEYLVDRGYISLINSVDAFDPWMGFRFSTLAYNAITRSFYNRDKTSVPVVPIDEKHDVGSDSIDLGHELWLDRMNVVLKSNTLNLREKKVLKYRFNAEKTLKETGVIFGITKERTRQIQIAALSKLKKSLTSDAILS